jgi:peroxiredoxin
VAIDTAEEGDPWPKAREFKEKHGLTYPILIDADGAVRKAFAVSHFPTNVIIDRDGKVRSIAAGFNATAIDQALRELMAR